MSSNLHSISLEELCHENCFPLFFARSFYWSFLFLPPSSGQHYSLFCLLYEVICNALCKRICLNFCLKGLLLLCRSPRLCSKDKKQEVMLICLFVCSYFWLIFPLVAILPVITESTFDLFEFSFCVMAFWEQWKWQSLSVQETMK